MAKHYFQTSGQVLVLPQRMVFARFNVKASIGAEGLFDLDAAIFLALSIGAKAPFSADSTT